MTKPHIPARLERMRVGEETYTDISQPDLNRALSYLRAKGYDFDQRPFDGGVFLFCVKSPNVITKGE